MHENFIFKYESNTKTASAYINNIVFFTVRIETWGPNSEDPEYPTVGFTEEGKGYNTCEGSSIIRKKDEVFEIYCPESGDGIDHLDEQVFLVLGKIR